MIFVSEFSFRVNLRISRAPFLRHSALSEHPCNPWLILFNPLTLQRFNPGEGIRLLKREHDVGDAVA